MSNSQGVPDEKQSTHCPHFMTEKLVVELSCVFTRDRLEASTSLFVRDRLAASSYSFPTTSPSTSTSSKIIKKNPSNYK
jgi:hypothetical protein